MPDHLNGGASPAPAPAVTGATRRPASDPESPTTRHLNFLTLTLIVVIGLILTLPIALPGRVQLELGQPAPTDIYAPQYFRYESEVLTGQDREKARQAAGPIYDYNGTLVESRRQQFNNALNTIQAARGTVGAPDPTRDERLRQVASPALTAEDVQALLNASAQDYSRLSSDALRIFDNLMVSGRIADETQLAGAREDLSAMFSSQLSVAERQAAAHLVGAFLAVNLTVNQERTEAAQAAAVAGVQPRTVEVQKGEIILRQGQIADQAAIEKLEKAGLSNPTVTAANAGAVFACAMIMLLLLHFYVLRLQPAVWRHQRSLMLLGLVLVAPTLVMRVIVPGHAVWPYVLPVAAASMLVAVLLDANLAIVVTFELGVFAALLTQGGFELPFFYIVGGLAAVFAIWRAERISTFVFSGFYIAVASLAAALLVRVVENQHLDVNGVSTLALAAGLNGALAASLTFATFTLLGSLFGITTVLQLLELAHPTQPLLRRLMREAPGTYHHSLVVSNLAEHAAERVGADPLLARVAAYYHDIGKVLNPSAFIENQSGIDNIHDTLDPVTSARLIREHITGGLTLARESRLPRRISDCIPQHHGTTLVRYFYHKALQDDPATSEDEFRCPGPKPQTKEAAILMLADGVEATVRSIAQAGRLESWEPSAPGQEPPSNSIRGVIKRIVHERLEEGQLDECDLTIRDLGSVEDAFYSMLKGIYHPRVIYPDKPALPPPAPVAPLVQSEDVVVLPAGSPLPSVIPVAQLPPADGSNGAANGHDGGGESLPPPAPDGIPAPKVERFHGSSTEPS